MAAAAPGRIVRTKPSVLQVGKYFPPYRGGIETHLQTLCSRLRGEVDLQTVVSNDNPRSSDEVVGGVEVKRLGRWLNIGAAPLCPSMLGVLQRSRADIVHIHLPNPVALLTFLISGHTGRLVLSYHSDVIRQRHLNLLYHPVLQRAIERSAALIVASPNYIESSPTLNRHRSRCSVIPYGIDYRDFDRIDSEKVAAIRRLYGQNLIVAVGRLVYYKGFEYLIRAMVGVDANLVILGNGPLRTPLEKMAVTLGIASRVTLLDGVADLTPYYQAADVFVLPSVARSEAFGIVQLEAMACRKPVINTALASGVPYVSLDGITGTTVPPADSEALAAAL
ncbi:MAG: glycosyltransferase, partial [Bryobacteraceae bacterium]|nr:glycosyltransferase [Bryobacteraceae bacterium]